MCTCIESLTPASLRRGGRGSSLAMAMAKEGGSKEEGALGHIRGDVETKPYLEWEMKPYLEWEARKPYLEWEATLQLHTAVGSTQSSLTPEGSSTGAVCAVRRRQA